MLSFFISFGIGRYKIGPLDLIGCLLSRFFDIGKTYSKEMMSVVWNIRLPRVLMASLVGAALSVSGLLMQTVFRNPMVSPDVIGTTNAAALGASIALLLGLNSAFIPPLAFLFSLFAMALVLLIASRTKKDQVLGLILSGIMIGSLFSSLVSFVKLVADPNNTLPSITYFLMGSLSGANYKDLLFMLILVLIGMIPVLLNSWRLNILTLTEDEAMSLGVNSKTLRIVAIISATLLSSSTVAYCGIIGWVGLVIPHIARLIIGSDTRKTIPSAILLGAGFLTLVDTISRSIATSEIPIGILTSLVGSPFFLFLILRQGKREYA